MALDASGRVLARARAGSLNFFGTARSAARRELRQTVRALACALGPAREWTRIVVGCSALFTDATPGEHRALAHGILPPDRTRIVSDCQTAWFGATLGRPGVVTIAGTGSIVLAGTEERLVRTGGWGHLLGDEGSAYWIARESIRATIAAEEGRGPRTRLQRDVAKGMGVRQLVDLVPLLYHPSFPKERLARLSEWLARSPALSDPVFRRICRDAGRELAGQTLAAARRAGLGRDDFRVHTIGAVLNRNAVVASSFRRALRQEARCSFVPPALSPVLGAAAMALSEAGVGLTPEIIANLAATGA